MQHMHCHREYMADMLTSSYIFAQVLSDNPSSETNHLHSVKRPCSQPDPGSRGDSPYSRPDRSESWSAGELGAQIERKPGAAIGGNPLLHRSSSGPSSHRHSAIPSAATLSQSGGCACDQSRSTYLTGSVRKQGSVGIQDTETEAGSSKGEGGQGGKADRQSNQEALVHSQQAGMQSCSASPITPCCCRPSPPDPSNAVCGASYEGTTGPAGMLCPCLRAALPCCSAWMRGASDHFTCLQAKQRTPGAFPFTVRQMSLMHLRRLRASLMMNKEARVNKECHATTLWTLSMQHLQLRSLWGRCTKQQSRVYKTRSAGLQTNIQVYYTHVASPAFDSPHRGYETDSRLTSKLQLTRSNSEPEHKGEDLCKRPLCALSWGEETLTEEE